MRSQCVGWCVVWGLLLGGAGCATAPAPVEQEPPRPMSLGLDAPYTGKVLADGRRTRFLVQVPSAGKLQVTLSWNNPLAMDRLLVQTGARQLETVPLRQQTRVEHVTEAIAGYYYVELVPGEEADSYNLVVTHTPAPESAPAPPAIR